MDWVLFCQVEVILLTIGLVVSFVISTRQTLKDNSFFKKISAFGKVLSDFGEKMSKKKTDEQSKNFNEILEILKKKKDEKE